MLAGLMPLAGRELGSAGIVEGTARLDGRRRGRRDRRMNAYWLKLEGETSALKQQMENAFRANFPETTAVVDPVLQTKRQLERPARRRRPAFRQRLFGAQRAHCAVVDRRPLGSVGAIEYRDGALKVSSRGAWQTTQRSGHAALGRRSKASRSGPSRTARRASRQQGRNGRDRAVLAGARAARAADLGAGGVVLVAVLLYLILIEPHGAASAGSSVPCRSSALRPQNSSPCWARSRG